jgi:hypothetical protein
MQKGTNKKRSALLSPAGGGSAAITKKFHSGVDLEERYSEGDRVIVDKGTIHEQHGTISFFFGKNYCEVSTDFGYDLPVHIGRLSRN